MPLHVSLRFPEHRGAPAYSNKQVSSEHDIEPGSRQHLWLDADLAAVDRSITPWVIVTAHRPM